MTVGRTGVAQSALERPTASLQWVRGAGAETCDDVDELTTRVTARLGRNPFVNEGAPRRIEGSVSREGERWSARIVVRDDADTPRGARELSHEGPSCAPLDAAVSLALALAIDPDATRVQPSAAEGRGGDTAETLPPRRTRRRVAREPSAVGRSDASVEVSARGALAVGLLPAPSLGASLAADGRLTGMLRLAAAVTFLPEQRTAWQGRESFAFGLTYASALACVAPVRTERVGFDACAGLHVGAIHAVVSDLLPTEPGSRVWTNVGARARGSLRVWGPFFVEAGVELTVPVLRSRFIVEGAPEAIRTVFLLPPAGFVATLGAGLAIW